MSDESSTQSNFLAEKIILIVSILALIIGLLVVGGSLLFNDPSYKTNPIDLTTGIVLVPLLITIPLFLIKICLDRIHWIKISIKPSWIFFLTIIAIVTVTAAGFFQGFNYLVRANQTLKNKYAAIDIAYQKRFNLIPNIAKTAKAYSDYEQGVVNDITDARKSYLGAKTVDDKVHSANQFDSGITTFVVYSENYPNLKSDSLYNGVIKSLSQSETEIAGAKKTYNDEVNVFNQYVDVFPNVLVARVSGFGDKEYIKADLNKAIYDSKTLLDSLKK